VLLLASLALTAGTLVACFRFGLTVVGVAAALPAVAVVVGILEWEPAVALAPVAGVLAAAQTARGRTYGLVIATASMPGLLYGLYLVGALHGEEMTLDQIGEEQLRQLKDSGLPALTAQGFALDLVRLFVILQPSGAVLYVLLKLVLGYALARYLGLWTGVVALPAPPPMREWRLWEQMIWILVGGMALWLLAGDGVLNTLAVNIVVVALVLYAVQGFSVARYYLWRMQVARTLEFVIYIIALITGWSGLILAGVGLMDTWFDWRRLGRRQSQEQEEVE
jgi:uncharacterized protein YybS (DUF2232 family)